MNFIYAETAFHHEGDKEYMLRLVEAAARVGAQGVKFQMLLDTQSFISTKNKIYQMVKDATMNQEEWLEVLERTTELGLKIILMPCDKRTMDLVNEGYYKPDFLDLHSVSFYDQDVLDGIKKSGIPLILGTGGRYIDEMKGKIEFFGDQLYCLMFGFQSFPTKYEDLHIEKISVLKRTFPDVKIGYADHAMYDEEGALTNNYEAFSLGARVFEKHLTVSEGVDRIDYQSAVGPEKFAEMVKTLQSMPDEIEPAPYTEEFPLSDAEIIYRNREKMAVAMSNLKKGQVIRREDFIFKMTGEPEGLTQVDQLLGKTLNIDVEHDQNILEGYLE